MPAKREKNRKLLLWNSGKNIKKILLLFISLLTIIIRLTHLKISNWWSISLARCEKKDSFILKKLIISIVAIASVICQIVLLKVHVQTVLKLINMGMSVKVAVVL